MLKLWFLFIHQYLNHSSLNIDATFSTSGSYLRCIQMNDSMKKGIKYGSRPLWSSNNISIGSKRDSDTQHIAKDSAWSESDLNGYDFEVRTRGYACPTISDHNQYILNRGILLAWRMIYFRVQQRFVGNKFIWKLENAKMEDAMEEGSFLSMFKII